VMQRIVAELFEYRMAGGGDLGLAITLDGHGRQGRGKRGPNPFPALAPRVRHPDGLPRLGAGRAFPGATPAPGDAECVRHPGRGAHDPRTPADAERTQDPRTC
jgi:hypothetical protein